MYRHIVFDFDGVLVDSNAIRIEGFRRLFRDFPEEQVDRLVAFSTVNGGLSRYEKIRHFFCGIRGEPVTEQDVAAYAREYSGIVKDDVVAARAIDGAEEFLRRAVPRYDLAVVSGSDQEELRDICRIRGLAAYFPDILGSPAGKAENLSALLKKNGWSAGACVLVGDSVNDYTAARAVRIDFIGRDSGMEDWSGYADVPSFSDFSDLAGFLKEEPS